jgi:branched-chain amino acid transport system permease protein
MAATASVTLTDPRVRWRPGTAGIAARVAVLAVLAGGLVVLPHLIPDVLVNVYSKAMVFGIVALSMNVLIGYAGQVSLGHQAFVGVGAFTSAYFLEKAALPWLAAVLGAVVIGALIALGLGAVALRVKGLYFALVTIAYGLFVERTLFNITALTGGGAGASAPRPAFASGDIVYGYVTLAFLILTWAFDWRLTASKAGRAIQALRDDERVAASWGINVRGYKLLAFMLSGGMAGLAGALFASIEQIVSPITFGFTLALTFVLMTVVGGVRSRPGVVIGGFVFAVLPTLLDSAHKAWGEGETVCATAPPNAVQLVIGLVVAGAVVERVVHAFKHGSTGAKVGWVVGGTPVVFAALVPLGLGGFLGGYCLWGTIDALWEPLIGTVLLLFTLIQFPGGIAEQFGPLFRWLSFRPFAQPRADAVGAGATERSAGAHS